MSYYLSREVPVVIPPTARCLCPKPGEDSAYYCGLVRAHRNPRAASQSLAFDCLCPCHRSAK